MISYHVMMVKKRNRIAAWLSLGDWDYLITVNKCEAFWRTRRSLSEQFCKYIQIYLLRKLILYEFQNAGMKYSVLETPEISKLHIFDKEYGENLTALCICQCSFITSSLFIVHMIALNKTE